MLAATVTIRRAQHLPYWLTRLCLERQVVGTALTGRFLSRRERSSATLRCFSSSWLRGERGSTSRRGSTYYGRYDTSTNDIEGTDIVEPTAVVLMGINIKLHRKILTWLNVKLLDAVLTKDAEQTLTGILARHFDYVVLRHP